MTNGGHPKTDKAPVKPKTEAEKLKGEAGSKPAKPKNAGN